MKREPSPYWKEMISHINDSWKKQKGNGYPFLGKDFKNLKNMTEIYPEWQLMSLWDVFMEAKSDWFDEAGKSISIFLSCLPWLVDDKRWKSRAREYELKMAPIDEEVLKVIK